MAALATVSVFAANTGISSGSDSDNGSLYRRASPSDVARKGDVVNDSSISLDGVQSISIVSGEVVLQDDSETAELRGSVLQSRSVNDYGFFIDIDASPLSSRLYVPSDYAENSFTVDSNGHLIGIRSSTFSCFSGNYTVRFPAYSSPQYRLTSGTGYTWTDIDISYIDSPNVGIIGARSNFWSDRFQALMLILIGGLAVCLYLKR